MSFEIENKTTDGLGIFFKKGSLFSELLKLPKVKEGYSYDWKDQHGVERDTISAVKYEPLKYSISCYLSATGVEDLQSKRIALLELISNPAGFVLKSETLGRSFKLYYEDSPSFNTINPIWVSGKLYCEFSLNLINNYDEVEVLYPLEDVNSLVLTELGEQIYVTDFKQIF